MPSRQKHARNRRMVLLLGGLFLASAFLSLGSGMAMNGQNQMARCPLMIANGSVVVCPMSLIDHLALWKSLFVAASPTLQLLLGLTLLAGIVPWLKNRLVLLQRHQTPQAQQKRRITEWINTCMDSLKHAFAQGILHGKRGELA